MISLVKRKIIHEDSAEGFLSEEIPEIFDDREVFLEKEPLSEESQEVLTSWGDKFKSNCQHSSYTPRTDNEKIAIAEKQKSKINHKKRKLD